jgi:hypothetical protein
VRQSNERRVRTHRPRAFRPGADDQWTDFYRRLGVAIVLNTFGQRAVQRRFLDRALRLVTRPTPPERP